MLREFVLAVMIGLLIASAATSWDLRNWRAFVFIVFSSGAMLLAGLLPFTPSVIVQSVLWGVSLLVLLNSGRYVSGLSRDEYRFVRAYIRLIDRIEHLASSADSIDAATNVAEFERIGNELRALSAPPGEWTEFRDAASNELHRRLTMMRLTLSPSPETMRIAQAQWKAIERRFRELVRERAQFWAGWPLRT